VKERIRLRMKAYDKRMLDQMVDRIVLIVKLTGATVAGPVHLPTKITRYTVLRSPHGDKKSREQFEMRTHKRLLDILEPTSETVEALMAVDVPAAVEIKVG
jgi:small subunit ribosomal protein S10